MKKSTLSKEEARLDMLSSEFSSNLRIEDTVEEDTQLKVQGIIDKCESDFSTECAVANIEQYDTKQENISSTEEPPSDNLEEATTGLENALHTNIDDHSAHIKPVTGKVKEKIITRKKMKEYNIISIRNNVARPPLYFKFDKCTTSLLELLIKHRLVGEYHNVIGRGSKSVVIHANCHGRYHAYFPCGNAVKIYKLGKDEDTNKALCKMVQREVDVLYTLSTKHFGNNFPHPVYHIKNIIVMSFIGTDQETAPSIETLPSEHSQEIYHLIVNEMKSWYNKLHLVHGNLSAKSILYWLNKLYYIGWSHFVLRDHPKALVKLMRDCQFVTKYFESRDVPVKTTEELFKDITGLDDVSKKVLEVIHTRDLWQDQNQTNPNRKGNIASKPSRNTRFK
ncbi:serine/threonine-protein kinase RIO1-like [Choristoneura fumiferana]|uniref:serine/threonine-protein kinase RIO1-like n=1 Tax=Choristoneura fumiferana TaxID=7141 RepID=UPI003D1539B9